MLTRLALMFVLHVLVMGFVVGRSTDFTRMSKLAWVFLYLVIFYVGWGLVFALFPQLVVPDLVNPAF